MKIFCFNPSRNSSLCKKILPFFFFCCCCCLFVFSKSIFNRMREDDWPEHAEQHQRESSVVETTNCCQLWSWGSIWGDNQRENWSLYIILRSQTLHKHETWSSKASFHTWHHFSLTSTKYSYMPTLSPLNHQHLHCPWLKLISKTLDQGKEGSYNWPFCNGISS